jgi:multidrug efflux pump subunit AcrB
VYRFSVRNPVVMTVAILVACLFGVLAVFRVPIQMVPDLDLRVVGVNTRWPGATPQDVEKEIIIEQEEYLRSIPGLERMTSRASTGSAAIELEFPFGVDINEVLIRVNNALAQVPDYPENVDEPQIDTSAYTDTSFMYFYITPLPGNPKGLDMVMMRDFLEDHVATALERVPGVSETTLWGGAERQIRIYVDPFKLAQREISIAELRQALRARNRDVSGGDLDSGKRRYLIRTIGRFDSVGDIEDSIIARRGAALVRLRDVGHAELSHFEVRSYSYANGRPNISIGIHRQTGVNVVELRDAVFAKAEEINERILGPRGMAMELSTEDVRYVEEAVAVVRQNLLIGAVLAAAVLFLFLRSISATLLGATGIPICAISAFLGLLLMDRTINVISLAGVAFAIGMTLDNSIVVLENIYRHMGMGKARLQAALDGVSEVWTAVLASTLTTVFVFLPIVFVEEEAGQLYSDIAIAISASILMSMAVAITVIPSACSRFLSPAAAHAGPRYGPQALGRRGVALVMACLHWLMADTTRRVVVAVGVLAVSVLIIATLTPKAEYLPEGEEQKVFAFMYTPPGYNIAQTHAALERMNAILLPHVGADPDAFDAGETDIPALTYVTSYALPQMMLMIVEATDRAQVESLRRVMKEKFAEVPGVISFVSRGSIFASNLGGTRAINLDISGPQLAPLFEAGLAAFRRANQIFDGAQIRPEPSSLALGQPLLEVRPDWDRAAEFDFDTEELGYTVWAFSDGAYVDEFFLGDDKIDMFLYSTSGTIEHPGDIERLQIYTPAGAVVPLAAVATVRETVNTETIRRVDGERTITLSIIPPREVPLEVGVETVQRELIDHLVRAGALSPEVRMEITGASDRLDSTRRALGGNFLVAILICYLLMVAIFSHWGFPLLIMTSVPIGVSGGIVGLWLFNFVGGHLDVLGIATVQQPFDVITMLGFLVLIGTVVNNPILIVEQTLKNIREHGMANATAIIEATRSRLRPIVMSAITTVFGLAPLVFLPGAGTELYRGLGAIVLFGLLFSAVVTLTFIPTVLALALELRARLGRAGAAAPGAAGGAR